MSVALARRTIRGDRAAAAAWHAATLIGLVFAGWWQATTPTNTDVSWLLDCARRLLDGGRFYVDFFEINPPASILLYVPAAALARWLPIGGADAVRLLVGMGFAASLWLSAAVLHAGALVEVRQRPALAALATAALLALPMNAFGEREHIAVLASTPFLACCAARATGSRPALPAALLAGVGAGLAIVIKPMFGLAFAGPVIAVLAGRSWRDALGAVEAWTAAAVAGAYAVGVMILVPAFATTILPVGLDVYLPVRRPLAELLASPGFVLWLLLSAAVPLGGVRGAAGRMTVILWTASAGFEAAALMQGKNFPYQTLPALALALLGAALPLTLGIAPPIARRAGLAAVLGIALVGGMVFLTDTYDPRRWSPGLAEAMVAIRPHPRVMAISAELALGHPFVEDLGGTWVGREPATWISAYAYELSGGPRHTGRLAPYVAAEQRVTAEDIRREGPDVILIDDTGWMAWIAADPALAAAFADYVRTGTYDTVALWARRDLVR